MSQGIDDSGILTMAIDLAGVGCWVLGVDSLRFWGTETGFLWLGYPSPQAPTNMNELAALIHQDDLARVSAWFEAVIAGQRGETLEDYRLRTSAGGWRWLQTKAELIAPNSSSDEARLLIVSRDVTQVHLLQVALTESEARWTSLVDEAPVGISLVGPAGLVKFVNRKESEYHSDSVIGKSILDDLPPETRSAMETAITKVLRDNVPTAVETYRRRADGTSVYFDNHLSPVRDPTGAKTAMLISLDVTPQHLVRRRQRKESRRNEILLTLHSSSYQGQRQMLRLGCLASKDLVDADVAYLFAVSPTDGDFQLVEASELDAYVDEMALFWPLVEQAWKENSAVNVQRGDRWQLAVSFVGVQAPGGVVVVESRHHPFLTDDERELRHLFSGLWQAIHSKEQEAQLEQLHRAVECTPVSIAIVDAQGEVQFGNRRFCSDVGVEIGPGALVNLWALHAELGSEAHLEALQQSLRERGGWQGELRFRRRDGTVISESVSVSPVSTSDDATPLFVVVKEDVTAQRAAQELVLQSQKMETVGQLAAGVAHDFNNLLTSILAYNEMIQRRAEAPESVRQFSEKIQLAGQRASALVSRLLAAGRRQRLNPEVMDLGEFLAGEESLLDSLARPAFSFIPNPAPENIPVEIDRTQMGQVVTNLVANAKDAIQERGSRILLRYGTSSEDGRSWAWFRVEDDGPGVPPDILSRIFEPFFTTKELGKGTGLGLSMVQGIVQQHRGRLAVTSEADKGAQFTVFLPLVDE